MSRRSTMMVVIDSHAVRLADYAANAGVSLDAMRRRLERRRPPYTSTDLLTDGRALDAARRSQLTRDHAKRAAVVALRETGASIRAIAREVNVSPARVQQLLASEGYSGNSSSNGSSS